MGHLDIVQWLVQEGGADIAERTNNGVTALLVAMFYCHASTVQWLLREGGSSITEVDNDGRGVWHKFGACIQQADADRPLPAEAALANLYSILRCYASPPDTTAFLAGLDPLPDAHRELLQRTENAHAHPRLAWHRARRLDVLGWSAPASDCVRVMFIPDLQDIIVSYVGSIALAPFLSAEEQMNAAVIAEAQEADDDARAHGRRVVRPRRE